jgi:hypothetical protein
MSLRKTYISSIKQELGYLPTWLPDVPVAVGDVLRTSGGSLERYRTLEDLNIPFRVDLGPSKSPRNFVTHGAVEVRTKVAGRALEGCGLGKAEAGLSIRFGREDAIYMQLADCQVQRIGGLATVSDLFVAAAEIDPLLDECMVVTEIGLCDRSTIFASKSSESSIDVSVSGLALAGGNPLLDLKAELTFKNERDLGLYIPGGSGLSPIFKASKLRRNWRAFWKPKNLSPTLGHSMGSNAPESPYEDVQDY